MQGGVCHFFSSSVLTYIFELHDDSSSIERHVQGGGGGVVIVSAESFTFYIKNIILYYLYMI